ncbi:MAG TPA: aspartyl/asparaginyl beta-hydroxylase domain-containing protein [Balneolales bacterium]|nr:aspartyl/asparaginyl beta-hydroxylase domain-containing protein [Balneolales bacterium]
MDNKLLAVGFHLLQKFEKLVGKYSIYGDKTFFDTRQFPWVKDIEANWMDIRKELDGVLKFRDEIPNFQDISSDQKSITTDNKWKTFFLYGYGFKSEQNCELCPKTAALMERIPGMKTAMFSILDGHKHIPPHRGPYKGVLRFHMGLIVPKPNTDCRIRVGNDYQSWEEGKGMVFDDTYNHEVWNDSDHQRVVLFVDFIRPLRFPVNILNKILIFLIGISPFVQEGKKNQTKWDEKLEKKINEVEKQLA